MNITRWEHYNEHIIECLRNETLIPILGSGFSCGTKTANKGVVPSGKEYKEYMLSEIVQSENITDEDISNIQDKSFREVCTYYESDDLVTKEKRRAYLRKNFKDASFETNDLRRKILNISWPYIYTLNIDDAIEKSSMYNTIVLPSRPFHDEVFKENKCVIKLHGDITEQVTYSDATKVFTSREYIDSLNNNRPLLNKLKTDYSNNNIIYIGCSLDDELDILLINSLQIQFEKKESATKVYYCAIEEPSKLLQIRLQTYGVTDVIVFDQFKDIYINLYQAWEAASSIQESQLSSYKSYRIRMLGTGKTDRDENKAYFLWAKSLANIKKREITVPYYFVHRYQVDKLIKQLDKHILHVISGNSFSGLTYLLIAIYCRVKDRKVYYFDCQAKIVDTALLELFSQQNAIFLFDNRVISRSQMDMLLENLNKIQERHNDIIVVDNSNQLTGLIDIYSRDGKIVENQYQIHQRYKGKLSDLEVKKINGRLSAVNIPPYTSYKHTFLDHLSYVQTQLRVRGKYDNIHAIFDTTEKIAVFIALAVQHVLYSSNIFELSITSEIEQAINQCTPFIEKVTTNRFERDPSDLSGVKYICNSSYWLKKELSEYLKTNGPSHIVEAYYYIIEQIIMDTPNLFYAREKYRYYIEFDSIYDIFMPSTRDNYQLGRSVYEQLQPLLGKDYHFMHQKAKCFFRSALNEEGEKSNIYLKTALDSIVTAISSIMIEMENSTSNLLRITYDHILFTHASIMCEIVNKESYSTVENLSFAVDLVYEAIMSPNNTRAIKDNMNITSRSIALFIREVSTNGVLNKVDERVRKKMSSIITKITQEKKV